MNTNNIDLGKSFNKLKKELKPELKPELKLEYSEYSMTRFGIGGMLVLTRDDKPIMPIPEEFYEDFVEILSKASAYDKVLKEGI